MKLFVVVIALAALLAPPAAAAPGRRTIQHRTTKASKATKPTKASTDPKIGAHARVAFSRAGELRPAQAVGRRLEPLTAEEETADRIQKLLRGPLRRGVTGLFVADARTGEPLFAVNATDPMNPASNVKLISTAAALELLGPEFRFPTRVLGPAPVNGVVKGDVFLLGSHDPTLTSSDMHEIAGAMALRGITSIEGSIVVGSDPTRDGIYRAVIPIEITATEAGKPPIATVPAGFDLVSVTVTAVTSTRVKRPRLTYKTELTTNEHGHPRISLTIGGTIRKGRETMYPLWTKQRTATAAYALIAALRAQSITVAGEMKVTELGEFIGDAVSTGALPIELGRHESRRVADIVARINKWSVNWLADRLIMTAAALARREAPSMELALDAMYGWLARHPHVAKDGIVLDTGSGLSYRTQITSQDLVSIVRSAGGFTRDSDPKLAEAWLRSLSVASTDGTLRNRFRHSNAAGRIVGKTGTLSTVIALSGILDIDPNRPLAFALVTNTDSPLAKGYVRKAHERVIGEICKYLTKTAKTAAATAPVPAIELEPAATSTSGPEIDPEDNPPDPVLDAETARSK